MEEEKKKKGPSKRPLLPTEFEVRNLDWAVGIKCQCGHEIDLFIRNIDIERVCSKCGRKYDIALRAYQLN